MVTVQGYSEASLSSHDDAVAFSDFLQKATDQIDSAAAHASVCIRLKESYGCTVNKSNLELVYSLQSMLAALNKSFCNIVIVEKNVILRNQKKFIHNISIEKDFGHDAVQQSLQNLEHSQKLMDKFATEETKHLFHLCITRANDMNHFFKVLKNSPKVMHSRPNTGKQ